jgi:hypothetical protein
VEQPEWLETSAQQFAIDCPTINLFQLVETMVGGISHRIKSSLNLSNSWIG